MEHKEIKRMAWNTVHYGIEFNYKNKRFSTAEKEKEKGKEKGKADIDEIKGIIKSCCKEVTIKCVDQKINKEDIDINGDVSFDYKKFKEDHELADERDIVWLKFTNSGHIGVVAASNDINFQIPSKEIDYDVIEGGRWKYNSSGILIHHVNLKWDNSHVLICPIIKRPDYMTRHGVEKIIGNSLIANDIPIIDYYSHRIGGK